MAETEREGVLRKEAEEASEAGKRRALVSLR